MKKWSLGSRDGGRQCARIDKGPRHRSGGSVCGLKAWAGRGAGLGGRGSSRVRGSPTADPPRPREEGSVAGRGILDLPECLGGKRSGVWTKRAWLAWRMQAGRRTELGESHPAPTVLGTPAQGEDEINRDGAALARDA